MYVEGPCNSRKLFTGRVESRVSLRKRLISETILLSRRMARQPTDFLTQLVGQRIKALRLEVGLTLEALAFQAELSKGHLSKLERGLQSPTVATLDVIARVLEVEVFDLIVQPDADERQTLLDISRHLTPLQTQELVRTAVKMTRTQKA